MGGQTGAIGILRQPPFWKGMRHGNQVHGVGLVPVVVRFTGVDMTGGTTTQQIPLFLAAALAAVGEWKVEACRFAADAAVATHATDGVSFSLRNTGSDGLGTDQLSASAGYSTLSAAGGGLVARAGKGISVEGPTSASPKKVYMLANEELELLITKLGAGVNLSAVNFVVTVYFRHGPPNA